MPWIDACATTDIDAEDLIRFDHAGATRRSTSPLMASFTPRRANAPMKMCTWRTAW